MSMRWPVRNVTVVWYFSVLPVMCGKCECVRTQTLLEPFSQAYYFGSERVSSRYATSPVQPDASFNDIKALCELSYPGRCLAFILHNLLSSHNFYQRCAYVCFWKYKHVMLATATYLIRTAFAVLKSDTARVVCVPSRCFSWSFSKRFNYRPYIHWDFSLSVQWSV